MMNDIRPVLIEYTKAYLKSIDQWDEDGSDYFFNGYETTKEMGYIVSYQNFHWNVDSDDMTQALEISNDQLLAFIWSRIPCIR